MREPHCPIFLVSLQACLCTCVCVSVMQSRGRDGGRWCRKSAEVREPICFSCSNCIPRYWSVVGARALYQKFSPAHTGIPPGSCQSWMWVGLGRDLSIERAMLKVGGCVGIGWEAQQVYKASDWSFTDTGPTSMLGTNKSSLNKAWLELTHHTLHPPTASAFTTWLNSLLSTNP